MPLSNPHASRHFLACLKVADQAAPDSILLHSRSLRPLSVIVIDLSASAAQQQSLFCLGKCVCACVYVSYVLVAHEMRFELSYSLANECNAQLGTYHCSIAIMAMTGDYHLALLLGSSFCLASLFGLKPMHDMGWNSASLYRLNFLRKARSS